MSLLYELSVLNSILIVFLDFWNESRSDHEHLLVHDPIIELHGVFLEQTVRDWFELDIVRKLANCVEECTACVRCGHAVLALETLECKQ